MKKCLTFLKEKKKDIELVIALMGKGLSLLGAIEKKLANVKEKKCASLTKNLYHFFKGTRDKFMTEYNSICFDYSCLDAKQYALKVYMNTFYSTAGNRVLHQLNREILNKLVTDFVKISSERYFQECDEVYDSGNGILKEEYWSRMVNISMEMIEKLCDEVNDFLRKDNRLSYFKMAYKEVLFPVVFTEKKKHYGISHECLIPEPYLYQISEPGEHFEYVVVENDLSQKALCIFYTINYDDRYQPSSEILLEVLKKLKDDNEVDGNEVDENKVNEDEVDENEVSKIRDALS
ncbi:hypothetical protein C1645_737265 [Glomus cerebriforme]|uniref:Uncharacterized protein n=1 Tax=Glomus cerebriforme TaxID=658196 RepID=A0A397T4U9_9GLOM|nr:hypothetical protein C1645_737265 [Glomus cerebriforme]